MFFLHNETFDNCKKKKFVLFIQNTVICFFDKNHNIYDLPYMPMLWSVKCKFVLNRTYWNETFHS